MFLKRNSNERSGLPALYEVDTFLDADWKDIMERFFTEPFFGGLADRGAFGLVKFPALDVEDKGEKLVVKADIPGMDKHGIKIRVEDNRLTISGEKKSEKKEEKDNYYHLERSFGKFQRAIELPAGVEAEKINASYKDGVLTIEVPKTKEAVGKGRDIEIS